MSHDDVVRAWREEAYWLGLSEGERGRVPLNPAGSIELLDDELARVVGGEGHPTHDPWSCPTYAAPTCDHCNYTRYSGGDRDPCCD